MKWSRIAGALVCLISTLVVIGGLANSQSDTQLHAAGTPALAYEKDGAMRFPSQYREWVYLSSGFNMSYTPQSAANDGENSVFDNVFVNPEAYSSFRNTGVWPDKTVLILELRTAQSKGSINKGGHFQSSMSHIEAHIKDASRFADKWAFFGFDGEKSGKLIPKSASCYSCHSQHAAVDTTFVQFYPTLYSIAEKKGTISQAYSREIAESSAHPAK